MFTYSKCRRFLGNFRKYGEILGFFKDFLGEFIFLGFLRIFRCENPAIYKMFAELYAFHVKKVER